MDDHVLFADALTATLRAEGVDVDATAHSGAQALAAARELSPAVMLIDAALPDGDGVEFGREIMSLSPATRIIVVAAEDDPRSKRAARRLGLHGYVTKDMPASRVTSVVRDALEGRRRFDGAAPTRSRVADRRVAALAEQLTDREREVLELLVRGLYGRAIARELGISPNTVRTHVNSILSKLRVHSRLEAAALAVRHSLVRVGDQ